ncbi:MAG: L-rhamnose mutarotase [Draconibacterium sp.]|nr:L-rhamnose mutarotase [Draconibacterium sp.]
MKNLYLIFFVIFFVACQTKKPNEKAEKVQRFGWVIKVKPDKLEEYKELHANPWQEVNAKLKEVNIQNYSIYYRDGLLFSYLEYTGDDFDADMKKMAADSITNEWWKLTDPCQEPVDSAEDGVWWADLEEVFHLY